MWYKTESDNKRIMWKILVENGYYTRGLIKYILMVRESLNDYSNLYGIITFPRPGHIIIYCFITLLIPSVVEMLI